MLAPTPDLPLEVVAGLAIAGEAARCKIDLVQRSDDAPQLVVDVGALVGRHIGKGLVPENPPLNKFHHIKGPANDVFVFTKTVHARDRDVGAFQPAHHGKLALDGVGRRQQFGHGARFGAHHIGQIGCDEFVGRIRLPAFEHLHLEGPAKARQVALQPTLEAGHIERVRRRNRFGPKKMIKLAHDGDEGKRWSPPWIGLEEAGFSRLPWQHASGHRGRAQPGHPARFATCPRVPWP